ncbi:MAG: hypothetical protein PWP54_642 [Thermosipho sp. (in: thermotogales)]|nr:hypothetical protein [Thermosipho sp. (in: thermotogales)]MDN5324605.1 hypothetical protein [Thermosipho sp. (in: thermotogales)]
MRKSIIVFLALVTISVFTNTFSNDNFELTVEIGWDKLATDTILIYYNKPINYESDHEIYLDLIKKLGVTRDTDDRTLIY